MTFIWLQAKRKAREALIDYLRRSLDEEGQMNGEAAR